MNASPAFQFYPADYTIGTKFFTPAERGVYMDCLCHQWDEGSVPGDDMRDLAIVMRCTEDEARALWVRVSRKFQRGGDGLWRNDRLESEREKQRIYREKQANNGKNGGRPRNPNKSDGLPKPFGRDNPEKATASVWVNPGETQDEPKRNPNESSSSSSSSSSSFSTPVPAKNAGVERGGGVMSPIEFEKLQRFNAYVGARLRIPRKLHSDFIAALGGQDTDARLRAWYADLDAEIEASGEAILPDVWKWAEARFKDWATTTTEDAEFQVMLAKAAAEDAAEAAAKGVRRG